jgi:hypothetical protein
MREVNHLLHSSRQSSSLSIDFSPRVLVKNQYQSYVAYAESSVIQIIYPDYYYIKFN